MVSGTKKKATTKFEDIPNFNPILLVGTQRLPDNKIRMAYLKTNSSVGRYELLDTEVYSEDQYIRKVKSLVREFEGR